MTELTTSGLLAFGRYGDWRVDIGEIVKDSRVRFYISLDHPNTKLQFGITNLSSITDIVNFLYHSNIAQVELELAKYSTGSLHLIWDEERLYIVNRQGTEWGQTDLLKIKVDDEAHKDLTAALEDAIDDLGHIAS